MKKIPSNSKPRDLAGDQFGWIMLHGMRFRVRIIKERRAYGRTDYLVESPEVGKRNSRRRRWVAGKSLQLINSKHEQDEKTITTE